MRNVPATSLLALAVSLSLAVGGPALAQDAPAPEPTPEPAPARTPTPPPATNSQIIVSGARLRGTVETPQPPVLELNEAVKVLTKVSRAGLGSGRG